MVGAPRAGTTSLHAYLRRVPGVYLPSIKEINFFSEFNTVSGGGGAEGFVDPQQYVSLFSGAAPGDAIGDATPTHLYSRGAAQRIHDRLPDARIVAVLRDPIERAHSQYLMTVGKAWERSSFFDAVQREANTPLERLRDWQLYVGLGLYYEQVRRYLDLFGPERVRIYIYEQVCGDWLSVVRDVCDFIGVPPPAEDVVGDVYLNEYRELRHATGARLARWLVDDQIMAGLQELLRRMPPFAGALLKAWDLRETLIPLYGRLFFGRAPKPAIDAEALVYLRGIYQPEVLRLEKLLGVDLSVWTRTLGARAGRPSPVSVP